MQIYSVIKNDGPANSLAWKFTGEDFNFFSQLIVAESEEAVFVKDGVAVEVFQGGKYTLSTHNYPFINKLVNSLSDGTSPFSCKVYYINKAHQLELFWGTDSPIQLRDPVLHLQTSIQARGSYSIQVTDSRAFLIKLIGNQVQAFTQQELNGYFRSAFLQCIKDEISRVIRESGKEILEICTEKSRIAAALAPELNRMLAEYGVRLVNFYISAIDIPEHDPSRAKLEEAFANKGVMSILGEDWARQQSADILRDLARNQGAGGVAAAGAGAGIGFAAGSAFGQMAQHMFSPADEGSPAASPDSARSGQETECPSCGTANPPGAKFCCECGGKLTLVAVKRTCSACGAELPEGAKFCTECGAKSE